MDELLQNIFQSYKIVLLKINEHISVYAAELIVMMLALQWAEDVKQEQITHLYSTQQQTGNGRKVFNNRKEDSITRRGHSGVNHSLYKI